MFHMLFRPICSQAYIGQFARVDVDIARARFRVASWQFSEWENVGCMTCCTIDNNALTPVPRAPIARLIVDLRSMLSGSACDPEVMV